MANEGMREVWATGSANWVRHQLLYDAVFAPFTTALLAAAGLAPGQRVLDVGCGTGTLLEAAVAAGAHPVGVDISASMAAAARRRVPGARVLVADAQDDDLLAAAQGAPFDRVVSRFGVMFFADPCAAFANLRAATAPGARLAFVCWRADEQDLFELGLRPLLARLDDPPGPSPSGVPGPLGLAEGAHVRRVLAASGWQDVTVEPVDGVCDYGVDGSDGVAERMAIVLGGRAGQAVRADLEPRLGPAGWDAAVEAGRQEVRERMVDGVVRFVAHAWLVTAGRESGRGSHNSTLA
ncbi:class I SAM-dependent methyltransferase [Occultella kanbiaonis]|uniref:class I SAM-dependent methyltransferase n=1 Tax=Occultella kanbiaonis TaxID=2675754 RepID=UPI0013D68AB4|nr:methyltransferase domain-containing protein [Occultella kanbiaonis]